VRKLILLKKISGLKKRLIEKFQHENKKLNKELSERLEKETNTL
jgi:hypothetical protein